ncbi:MAG: hypothetical protein L3J07_03230 [Candidatus Magasanikbacteria bacterium]|nr:hypothetical protein [Candidatus Magasanikbacteria bacterium]
MDLFYIIFTLIIFLFLFYAFYLKFSNRLENNGFSIFDFLNNIFDVILLKIFGAIGVKKEKEELTFSEEQEKNYDDGYIRRMKHRFNKIPKESSRDFWQEREYLKDLIFRHLPYWCKRKREIKKILIKLEERKIELDILGRHSNNLGDIAVNSNNCKIADLVGELREVKNKIGDCNIALSHFEDEIDMIQLLQRSNIDSDLTIPTLKNISEKYFLDRQVGIDELQHELDFDIFAELGEDEKEIVEEGDECEV